MHLLLFLISLSCVASLDNGITLPPLGWSTWNHFRGAINETLIKSVADAMVASGLVEAGYTHINIDDAWALPARDASGDLVPNPALWPSGMPALAAYVAARGMTLGIYTSHCEFTCQGFPGSLGHEEQDAALFASWPVALVKNDNCAGRAGLPACDDAAAFCAMRDALNRTGRRIAYQVHWGNSVYPQRTIAGVANSWRVAVDMSATWASVLRLADDAAPLNALSRPGAFLDLDMLEVGNGMTAAQDRSHFALWCFFASPLIAGNDPRAMAPAARDTLRTRALIAVDQDALVVAARLVAAAPGCTFGGNQPGEACAWQAFARPLADGSTALLILNRGAAPAANVTVDVAFTLLDGVTGTNAVFDLWRDNAPLGDFTGSFAATVEPFDTAAVRLVPKTAPAGA
jgi:alpha-galactosidase